MVVVGVDPLWADVVVVAAAAVVGVGSLVLLAVLSFEVHLLPYQTLSSFALFILCFWMVADT